jgi:Flp pilus assembly pilin Flp
MEMNWLTRLKNFWNDEDGQSTTEYILILAVVVMVAVKVKEKILKATDQAGKSLDGEIQEFFNNG